MGTRRPRALLPGRLARRAGLLLGLALGCSYTPWSEPSPLSCSEGHDAFDDCCCFFSEEGTCDMQGPRCFISVQCSKDAWISSRGCPLTGSVSLSTSIRDPEDVECALQALQDLEANRVSWTMQVREGQLGPMKEFSMSLQFTGEHREAFVVVSGLADGGPRTLIVRKSLRDREYFEACAGLETTMARFECLTHAVEGPDIEVCERL